MAGGFDKDAAPPVLSLPRVAGATTRREPQGHGAAHFRIAEELLQCAAPSGGAKKAHRGSLTEGGAKSAVFHGVALSRESESQQSWRRGAQPSPERFIKLSRQIATRYCNQVQSNDSQTDCGSRPLSPDEPNNKAIQRPLGPAN